MIRQKSHTFNWNFRPIEMKTEKIIITIMPNIVVRDVWSGFIVTNWWQMLKKKNDFVSNSSNEIISNHWLRINLSVSRLFHGQIIRVDN